MLLVVEKDNLGPVLVLSGAALRVINRIVKSSTVSCMSSPNYEDILANLASLHSSPRLIGYSTNYHNKYQKYPKLHCSYSLPSVLSSSTSTQPHRATPPSNTYHTREKPRHHRRSARIRTRYLIGKSSSMMEVTSYHPFFAEEMGALERDGR